MAAPRPRLGEPSDYASCDSSDCSPNPAPPLPSSSPGSHSRTNFINGLIIAASTLAFLIICLSIFLLFVRRRRQQQRRRREALLEAALAPAPNNPDGGGDGADLEDAGDDDDEEEVVHHAWHIRTVGLDQAAIESIALTRYRAGGALGASDCAVCLGEFDDGELLRLLPRCAHAFHAHCIDTWLRAHVSCPICRSHVLDPPAAAAEGRAAEQPDSPAGTVDDAGRAAMNNIETTGHEQLDHQQASEQSEVRVQIDQRDEDSNSPEQPHRQPGPRVGNFRRVVSMDSPSPMAAASEADEQPGGEKQGIGGVVQCELLSPGSGCSGGSPKNNNRGMKRSLSVGSRWALVSRHCRRSSSLLPL
ncbi:hypothetical protein PR202_ga01762 [Eleusine coracana subsp. coracana]|uniref:RING-type E3 ubiquitin transferase n=1 Tax=Eleusine coracana subsp. coracana TaxID=191504 RepID=A0AAV5BHQ2_ELECO|nr:hypothetical protein QOZ80_2AG0134810 [Eleusine coracana subsp. coracana]GJM85323.1 hypothetical protein PR202_ga01075 [Eleusine coracana subsp. coracana]GJM85951.1 hypothetical protein PR202_ga01762 [Eleusine coracana subsp. coracana]